MIKVAILTISDRCSRHELKDQSGLIIKEKVKELPAEIIQYEIVPDELEIIKEKLINYADQLKADLILTCGGTGLSPRDLTPEATSEVISKEVPGIPVAMLLEGLKKTKRAMLSRAKAGIRGKSLIINLPGSAKAVQESLPLILDIIPHALDMLQGKGHLYKEKSKFRPF